MRSFFITYYSYVYSNSNYAYSNIVHRRLLRVVWYPHSAVVIRGTLWLGWSSTSQELFEYALPHSDVTMLHATMHTRWTAYLGSMHTKLSTMHTCSTKLSIQIFQWHHVVVVRGCCTMHDCAAVQYSNRITPGAKRYRTAPRYSICAYPHASTHMHTVVAWLLLIVHACSPCCKTVPRCDRYVLFLTDYIVSFKEERSRYTVF